MKAIPTHEATEVANALAEIIWELGAQGLDGVCCAGLSLVEHRALGRLGAAPHCTVQSLGDGASLTKSGATRLVDRLEDRGMLERERSAEDGRVCCVVLTPAGRLALTEANQAFALRLEGLLSRLTVEQRAQLGQTLPALAQAVRRESDGPCC